MGFIKVTSLTGEDPYRDCVFLREEEELKDEFKDKYIFWHTTRREIGTVNRNDIDDHGNVTENSYGGYHPIYRKYHVYRRVSL